MDTKIYSRLIEVLIEIQTLNGQAMPEIGDDTRPVVDLPGFDSLSAAEVIIILSERLEHEFEPSIMVTGQEGLPASIQEIVMAISQSLQPEGVGQ